MVIMPHALVLKLQRHRSQNQSDDSFATRAVRAEKYESFGFAAVSRPLPSRQKNTPGRSAFLYLQ
jgi:hypothetical protein